MKLYYLVSCLLAAGLLVVFPELSLAHGGGGGGHGGGGRGGGHGFGGGGFGGHGFGGGGGPGFGGGGFGGRGFGAGGLWWGRFWRMRRRFQRGRLWIGIQRDAWICGSRFFWSGRSWSLR